MKKILSILASIGLTSTAASAVVACGNNKVIPVETVNKTATDLILAVDHQSAILKLSQAEALQLQLVQQNENGYTNGANLPEAAQVVLINGVNIVATFTPDLQSGTIMVTLKANKAVTAPVVNFIFGGGSAKLTVTNLNLDFIAKQMVKKSAVLGVDHQSATLKLSTDETLALGLMKEVAPGSYQYDKNYPFPTNGVLNTILADGTNVEAKIVLSSDATGSISLTSDKPMNGKSNVGLVFGDYVLMIDYNLRKDAEIAANHQSATLTLTTTEALLLDLIQKDDDDTYQDGANWQTTLTTTIDSATITAGLVRNDDGLVTINLTTNQPMTQAQDVEFVIGTYKLIVNWLSLDFQKIIKTVIATDHQSATLKLSTDETLALGLMKEVAHGSYQYDKNYPFPTNGVLNTILANGTNVKAKIELSSDATGSISLTSDKQLVLRSVITFNFGNYTLEINVN